MRWSAILRTGVVAIAIGGANELRGQSLLDPLNPFAPPSKSSQSGKEKQRENGTADVSGSSSSSGRSFTNEPILSAQALLDSLNPSSTKSGNASGNQKSAKQSSTDPANLFDLRAPTPIALPPLILGTASENWKGTWRDPDQMVIRGAKHFDVQQIRDKLLADLEVIDARHPLAPRDNYPNVLADRCRTGYLHSGFIDVKVDAELEENETRVVVTIDEGPESLCGNVKVEGAIYFKPHELATWLTSKQPPADAHPAGLNDTDEGTVIGWVTEDGKNAKLESPAWEISQPVHADDGGKQKLHDKIARGLAELGLPWAKFDFIYAPSDKPQFKDLQINIIEEGQPAIVGGIEVIGNKRDSAEDITQFLGVKPGMLLRESARLLLWQKLWMSGRYRFQNVDLIPPSPLGDPVKLKITVWEYAPVTPINKPLNEVETALLRCRDWIIAARDDGQDLAICSIGNQAFSLIVSADTRFLLHLEPSTANLIEGAKDSQASIYIAAVTANRLILASGQKANRFECPIDGSKIFFDISVRPRFDPANPEKDDFETCFCGGRHSVKGISSFSLAPVAMLALKHKGDQKLEQDGDICSLTNQANGRFMRFKKRTGELLDFSMKAADPHCDGIRVHFQKGAFDEQFNTVIRKLDNSMASDDNQYDPARPISSMIEFLLDSRHVDALSSYFYVAPTERSPRLARLARKMTAVGLLQPIDLWWLRLKSKSESEVEFKIPKRLELNQDLLGLLTYSACELMATVSEEGVPEDSWPAVLLRAVAGIGMKRTKYVESDIRLLFGSKHFGPVGHLAAAETIRVLNNITLSETFARRGLAKLNVNDFCNDCAPLINPKTPAGRTICHLATILRELNDDEAQELGDLMLGENGHILVDFVRGIRECNLQPIEEALPTLLPIAWNRGLKEVIEQRLHTLAGDDVSVATKPAESDEQNRKK